MNTLPCPCNSLKRIARLRNELHGLVAITSLFRNSRGRSWQVISLENLVDDCRAELFSEEAAHFALHCGHVEELAVVSPEAA